MKRKSITDIDASLYRNGWLRLSMGAALALGQSPIDGAYFERTASERDVLRVLLEWDRLSGRLTLRGGEGPHKLRVYARFAKGGTRKLIQPLFMIIVPSKLLRASKGLRVPSTRRFTLTMVAERTLVLDRAGGG